MKIYLVGGAVRDELLGRPVVEKDWVVVGGTPEEMIAQGFQPVGKDFPVFLHPKTHEEYALARTERKTGKGYKGFHFYTAAEVTLEADLIRRDLTINAMAKNKESGELVDPYGGQQDLQKKLLHHVSPAFSEDPVRILRVARFASQLPDFQVHPETNALMQQMVKSGEIDALVAERVWKELSRVLIAQNPVRFFEVLKKCGALFILFPEINDHVDLTVLQRAVTLSPEGIVRFSALLYYLSQADINFICDRFRIPSEFGELALLVSKFHTTYHQLNTRDAAELLSILKSVDAFRRPKRFSNWIMACHAIYPSQNHFEILMKALVAAKSVDTHSLVTQKLQGKAFADALQKLQLSAIGKIV
ncbi:MAG: multifunctional CCA tRNA nucleotidyl transferase/2'3'-cyclic phosphodiesterase/2'nucleotidase/phosphatase [Gammaproteobacteria bacterium RIFCSPHIGHO2_02_FULL_39_13]|nr:MAG: multifunctional CCA tRNA nucleotidyl transferase/2'3'-cyclic phosphodiesterase/2'nucleotidase/phosphatase [Gammaproteobacteria bacterium RIFCSPHIGHO2_02_FULL_39_13]OGT50589.1 MAG: multifunctional CCA tRNA nucleotidyl transferase/2'3'-cyclic phosphodiesterase/2'nucleotidase/phosphatase [Gammaproteobacteria bacterium RIFCSPHIGHO2_12_FULL_39_24]